jgi:beta-1,4-mannosyl-glycoprotein beta-1,4-N-acetylglucosaminyltransferase
MHDHTEQKQKAMQEAATGKTFKIIDCLTFFNELELLRLRIKILEDHVDHFIIAEAHQTFTGLPKKCLLTQEQASDIVNHPKVTIITIDLPADSSAWERENLQRNALGAPAQSLVSSCNDIILLSDIDEIPSPESIKQAVAELHQTSKKTLLVFEQRLFYFRLNYELVSSRKLPWLGTIAVKANHQVAMGCMRATGRNLRGRKHRHLNDKSFARKQIQRGGWHFSYMGDNRLLNQKLESFSHQETSVQNAKNIQVDQLIEHRGSLFAHASAHETWAIVPIESLGLPITALEDIRSSHLVCQTPCTPVSTLINEAFRKSTLLNFSIGNIEINIRKKTRK